jgi:preprotein translocase subunit SecB
MTTNESANPNAEAQRQFSIQKIYVKDVSLETPNSPQAFREQWQPDVSVQLGNSARVLAENVHEVVTTVTVTAKLGEKTAYLVEVHQAGIFTIAGFETEELGPMVGSFCPNILFPYAREAVSDLVVKAGFPPLLLAPVNFDAIYAQHQAQLRHQQGESEGQDVH